MKNLFFKSKFSYFYISQAFEHPKALPRVFFDIKIENAKSQRVIIELFENLVPRTTENFLRLTLGTHKNSSGKILTYKNSIFYRIVPGFAIQGGDVVTNNGKGGESIYGKYFPDESFSLSHDREGLLTMANNGPNTNNSQFLITLGPAKWLDMKNVVFGEIVHGLEVLNSLEKCGSTTGKVTKKVVVENCGKVDEKEYHKYDRHEHHDILAGGGH